MRLHPLRPRYKYFKASREEIMDEYFNLTRTLLLIIGLWPLQTSKFQQYQYICILATITGAIVIQLTVLITSKCTTDLIIKIFSLAFGIIIVEIKYISLRINNKAVKYIIEYLHYIYANLKDHNEIVIIKAYRSKANRLTAVLMVLLISYMLIHIFIQLWPTFCNIILSMNESQQRRLYIMTEYFIDQEKYFYLLSLHIYTCYYITIFILLVTGTSFYTYLQYLCGMFKIASYRIESTMKIYVSQNGLRNEKSLYKDIVRAIDIQRKAMMIGEYLMSTFEVMYLFLIGFGVALLSTNIFRTFQILSSEFHIEELGISSLMLISCIIYMFLCNLTGQDVTDHYNDVFDTTYNIQWYLAPLHIQKLIVFLMLKGNKSFGLNVAGLFVASLECFATLANASLSYFILLHSMRQ